MSIVFPTLSDNVEVPFFYGEFDPSQASAAASVMPYTVLLVGQMLETGKATPFERCRPMSDAQANELFGEGSMLAEMCSAYLKADSITKMYAIPLPDAPEGETAKGAIKLSGKVTNAAPLNLYIGGKRIRAQASFEMDAKTVCENLVRAINERPDLPVTAIAKDDAVELSFKHKGECGNDLDMRFSYRDEPLPHGLDIKIEAMSGGQANPDMAELISAMGNDQYHIIAFPYHDLASLDYLKEELADRWGPMRMIDGQAITVMRGSFGTITSLASSRNDKHLTIFPSENSPTSPWADAAATSGVIAHFGQNDPARPFHTLEIPGVLAPHERDLWPSYPEKNQGLFEGVSTRYVAPDGTVRIQKAITTYLVNELGAEDRAFVSLHSPLTLSYLRFDWGNYLKLKYPRHKLASDADAKHYGNQPIMTPKLGKAEAIARCQSVWLPKGLVENFDQFKKDLQCERHSTNVNRLDWLIRPDLVNQFEIAGTLFRHIV